MPNDLLTITDFGALPYDEAYRIQTETLERVLAHRQAQPARIGHILLVEHDPPVITVSRRPEARQHLTATDQQLAAAGVTVAQTDRGGDITYHGPGQLVVYPILDLNTVKLRLHEYMRFLEQAVIDTCAHFGVEAGRDHCATGVWTPPPPPAPPSPSQSESNNATSSSAKICAMGVRVRRWVSMHGLALNVTTNLDHFNLIVPCGLAGRTVTSLHRELGERCPDITDVKNSLTEKLSSMLQSRYESLQD